MDIQYKSFNTNLEPVFSILLPSWNNLVFLQLCINSIRINSRYKHQVIIHINEGNDGTLEWIKEQEIDYTYSPQNIGICYAVNAAASLAKADYIVYMNDDMYVCPDWDFYLFEEIKQQTDDYFFLSSTLIEPRFTGNACVMAPYDFGNGPASFNEAKLLDQYQSIPFTNWTGSSWPPNVLSKRLWHLVGGYSTEFSPGMYSDPDFSMKLWIAGVRNFKGVAQSRVYHFMSKSTGKLTVKVNGRKNFLKKWGISAGMFYRFYLNMGSQYNGFLSEPIQNKKFRLKKFICKIKRFV